MMRTSGGTRPWAFVGGVLLVAAGLAAAHAAAPTKIRLKLKNVSLVQGAAALSQAAGVSLEVPETLRQAPVTGKTTSKTDFDWSGVSFPVALRQLCTRFGMVPLVSRDGYQLVPDAPVFKKSLPLRIQEQEHAGVRMFLGNTGWGRGTRMHVGDKVSGGEPVLHLTFALQLGDRDRGTVRGLRNVVARDDQGAVLKQLGPSGFPQRFFPDEWAQTITLQAPSARATRLVSIEGDLLVHGTTRQRVYEAKVPPRRDATRVSADGVTIEVQPPQPIPVGAEDGPGYQIRASLRVSPEGELKPDGDSVGFQVIDVQGKPLPQSPIPIDGGEKAGPLLFEHIRRYGPTQSGPAKVRVSWREQSPERPLFTFRMTDVAVPVRP